jgi:hypothetical protein
MKRRSWRWHSIRWKAQHTTPWGFIPAACKFPRALSSEPNLRKPTQTYRRNVDEMNRKIRVAKLDKLPECKHKQSLKKLRISKKFSPPNQFIELTKQPIKSAE